MERPLFDILSLRHSCIHAHQFRRNQKSTGPLLGSGSCFALPPPSMESCASCTCGISASMHVKTGYSARSLACCWEEAQGFPKSVADVFQSSSYELFHSIEFILGSLLRILRPRHTLRPCKYS